jgi:UDP-N-acetylglucosamine 2-epimerase (non-hydrolysing)
VQSLKPFCYFDYNKLQINSYCVISDSGTLAEETAILGFPGVSIRTSTERPEVFDKGVMILGGINTNDILQSIELSRSMWDNKEHMENVPDYDEINVSVKIVKIIQSYTKIVNKVIWGK